MAEHRTDDHRLIEEYLVGLRRSLGTRPDADAVVLELRDHLLVAVDRHERNGVAPIEAERQALAELGDAEVVATSFAHNARGNPAVPTGFTRVAGFAGYTTVFGVVTAVVCFAISAWIEEQDGYWSTASQVWGGVASVGVLVTTISLLVLVVGMARRHGGLGWTGWFAISIAALGAFTSLAAWAVPVWCTLTAASWVILAIATRREGIAPAKAIAAVAAGLLAVPVMALVDRPLPPGVAIVGATAAAGLACWGAVALARFLAAELPTTSDLPPVATT